MRRIRFALVAMGLVALLAAACAGPAEEELTFDQAKSLASKQGKLLLVDFYTDW
jgi:hypothetical protein